MNKKKKKIILSNNLVIGNLLLTIPFFALSCSNTKPSNSEEKTDYKKIFQEAYDGFNIIVKPNVDISKILSSSITSENELLIYFDLQNTKTNVKYEFLNSKQEQNDQTKLMVTYKISYLDYSNIKTIVLNGFKDPSHGNEDNNDINFESIYKNFQITKKIDVNTSDLYTSYLNNEFEVLKYFDIIKGDFPNSTYSFVSSRPNSSNYEILDIKYKIKYKNNVKLKTFSFNNFKKISTEQENDFNYAIDYFDVFSKQNKDISNILASSIINKTEFEKYFEYDEIANVNIEFVSCEQDLLDVTKLIAKFKITHEDNNSLSHTKTIIISGFLDPSVGPITSEQQKEKNKEILNEIIQLLTLNEIKDHKNISARDFVEKNQFLNYFKINREEIFDLKLSKDLILPEVPKIERHTRDLNSIIITSTIFVGKGDQKMSAQKQFEVNNFKNLISLLDSNPAPNITIPLNSESYKGKLEPVSFDKITSETSYLNYIDNKFTFEEAKLEMMYQLRFWMYQMFSDNFSEINYWIEGWKTQNDPMTAKIEGIVKEDVNDVEFWIQQIGNIDDQKKKVDLKTNQRIKITLKIENPKNWRPSSLVRFGHLDGIEGFSFAKGCKNMTSDTYIKDVGASSFDRASINVEINGVSQITMNRWNQFLGPLFTLSTRVPLKK